MTVTLTLNEITPDQAEQVLDLLRGLRGTDPAPKTKKVPAKAEQIEPDEFEDAPTKAEDLAGKTGMIEIDVDAIPRDTASNTSATAIILAQRGISSSLSPSGYPLPLHFS